MNQKELKELIEFLIEKDIAEFELERGDVRLRVKRGSEPVMSVVAAPGPVLAPPVPAVGPSVSPAELTTTASASPTRAEPVAPAAEEKDLFIVKSPIVGTFYEAPSPGSPPFVNIGDRVETGQVLCIIEAMKLMNEIESDASGIIAKRMVNNGQPVEYGQPLFAIKTS
jgi:acetyl-CoA carboxylase biotin carboxyl carrier protein